MQIDPIPFVDLKSQYRALAPELNAAVTRVMERSDFILGDDVRLFEEEFGAFCQAKHCVSVANGTDALELALFACGIGPGDEVITTTHTFIATVQAIAQVGARPVLVDCDPALWTINPSQVAAAVTRRTRAIVPVHLYGHPADMDPILEIARQHKLIVLEDACQAHGAEYKGRRCGSMGDLAAFSFYPGKNLGAYGDGGAITTSRADLAEKLRLLRNHGQRVKYEHVCKGFNSRLDTMQAAILRIKLKHLEQWNEARRQAARRYDDLLAGSGVTPRKAAPYAKHVYHLYVVRTPDRKRLQAALDAQHIAYGIHYPIPVHLQPAFADLGCGPGSFPVAEAIARDIVSLPIYPEISAEQIQRVAEACRKAAAS